MLGWRKQVARKGRDRRTQDRLALAVCALHGLKFCPIIALCASVLQFIFMLIGLGWAVSGIKEGDTLRLGGTLFRLEGIDAPELDQVCLDGNGAQWACGIESRDALIRFISNRMVSCQDNGPDPGYPDRRLGICWVAEETVSLNQRLVREGWALNFDPKQRFKAEQAEAQENRRGLWKGCFVAPWDLRNWRKSTASLQSMRSSRHAQPSLSRQYRDAARLPDQRQSRGARPRGRASRHLPSGVAAATRPPRNRTDGFAGRRGQGCGFRKSYRC
jgi:endonuclease YncB( thermonuclease family)